MEGEIWIDNNLVNVKDLKRYTCYVGEDAGLRKWGGLKPMTVAEQIQYGVKKGYSFCNSIEGIKLQFELSSGRFNRPIKYCSGERWRASMAIGYALGKRIYCFPWLNTRFIKSLSCLKICFDLLLKHGAIIIIPTSKGSVLDEIVEHYEIINMDYVEK